MSLILSTPSQGFLSWLCWRELPPRETPPPLAEGYKRKKNGCEKTTGLKETVMDIWKASSCSCFMSFSGLLPDMSPLLNVLTLLWRLWQKCFSASRGAVAFLTSFAASQFTQSCRQIADGPHPECVCVHTWSSSEGVNNYFAKGQNSDPSLVFKALSLTLNHQSSLQLPQWRENFLLSF